MAKQSDDNRWWWELLRPALIAMIVALLVSLGVELPRSYEAQGVSHFSAVYATDDVQAGDDLVAGDDLTVADSAGVGSFLNLSAATAISCTDGSVITMTAMYQPLQSAGTVTPTLSTAATGVTTGTLLYLVNTSDTTINLADSSTAKLAGALALGQYDSAWLAFDGTNWVELSRSNN